MQSVVISKDEHRQTYGSQPRCASFPVLWCTSCNLTQLWYLDPFSELAMEEHIKGSCSVWYYRGWHPCINLL